MTREEFQQEAADAMRQFAAITEKRHRGPTGIPRPPEITVKQEYRVTHEHSPIKLRKIAKSS